MTQSFVIISIVLIIIFEKFISASKRENRLASPFPKSTPPAYRILFAGDMMFDRKIRTSMEKRGFDHVFAELATTLHAYDMVISNLEGTITTHPTRSVDTAWDDPNHFLFTFDPRIAPMLNRHNFTAVSLANNHSDDFGLDGVTQTKQFLAESNVNFFGNTGFEKKPIDRVFVKDDINPSFALVGYNQFVPDGLATALVDIQFANTSADLVIVMPHWGPEYKSTANKEIVKEAHHLIDAGADLIIGNHPHMVQQREEYKGKTIYYSLGNFVFDQYFDPRFQQGLLVGVEIYTDGSMRFTDLSIKTENTGQTKLSQ